MQPTKNESPLDKELIAHIKESLAAHEEAYMEGAWEKFSLTQQPQKKPLLWISYVSSIAAALLLVFLGFYFSGKNLQSENLQVVQHHKGVNLEGLEKQSEVQPTHIKSEPISSPKGVKMKLSMTSHLPAEDPSPTIAPVIVAATVLPSTTTVVSGIETPSLEPEKSPIVEKKADIMEFLIAESKKNESKSLSILDDRESKLSIGFVLAPSLSEEKKLTMGYGINMGYNISEKISLNSGISYNEMTTSKNMTLPATSSLINNVVDSKNLESIKERVVGLDIPLEVKYHINKSFYANVGVSAFAVIDQNRDEVFVQNRVAQSSPNAGGNGLAGPAGTGDRLTNNFVLNSERSTVRTPDDAFDNYAFLGFYNFSFGYQKRIAKQHFISIEPFLKLPMKQMSNDNLKLIGSGIKLKFDF